MLKVIVTALLTAVVTSFFWIWFYSEVPQASPTVERRGSVVTVKPERAAPVQVAQQLELGPAGLALPVVGIKAAQLSDTYNDARTGGRRHDAIDIMAPRGTPVIAAADGTVEKLFNSVRGGLTIYVRAADARWIYYYAHLQGYAPGLAEGRPVKRGQVIGSVGSSGDADPAAPHLHFVINRMAPGERWWNGTPINPYPLLAGKRASG